MTGRAQQLQSYPLRGLDDAGSGSEDDEGPSREERVEVLLSLSCNLAGFTISVPVLGQRRARRRLSSSPCQRGPVGQREAVAAAPLQAAQPASACLPADIVELQQLLLEKDPHLLQRLAAAGEPPDEPFFRRWLIARRGSVACAAAAIVAHAEWRAALVGAEGRVTEESIPAELASGKVFLQGVDGEGHAVVVVKASRHNMNVRDLSETRRLICYTLDNAAAAADPCLNPLGRICCLFDLSGLGFRNLDAKALAAIFELLQQYYPERLARLYFINAPLIFNAVWTVVSPVVSANTRQKIRFVGGRSGRSTLAAAVPSSVLPAEYGGAAELVPVEEAVAARRSAAAAAAAAALAKGQGSSGVGGSGRWGWRGKLAGARQGLGAARSWVGSGASGAGRAVAGVARAAARRVQAARKAGRWAPPRPLQQLLVPGLLLSVLRQAGRALAWAWQRAQLRITAG